MKNKSKTLIYLFLISIGFSIVNTNAQVTTNMLFSDSDIVESGYIAYFQVELSQSDTTLRADLVASAQVDFGLYDQDEWEDFLVGGSDPIPLIYQGGVTVGSITKILNKGIYYLTIDNGGVSDCSYDITVYESYEPSSGFGKLYVIIAVGIVVFVIIGITAYVRSRRRRESSVQYQTQTAQVGPYQPITQQPSEYKPPTSEQTVFDAKPKGLQICPNCGADEEISAKFCTNCGGKLEG